MKDALTESNFVYQELEFPRVLEQLSGFCQSEQGRDRVAGLPILVDSGEIQQAQQQYQLVATQLDKGRQLDLAGGQDVHLPDFFSEGNYLEPLDLLTLHRNYRIVKSIQRFVRDIPALEEHLVSFEEMPEWDRQMERTFETDGSVREDATSALKKLYQDSRKAEREITRLLKGLLDRHADIVMDSIVTRRSGRFVIPIRQDFKGRIDCLVHDTSASGATAYAEPFEAVEANNRIQRIQQDIQREISRLLQSLTGQVMERREMFIWMNQVIGYFDSMQARYRFARKYRALIPEIAGDQTTVLLKARHPVLLFNRVDVVPNDVRMNPNCPVLVVSGSNTGGKTVFLKMTGLLQLMNQAVIPVPVDDGSHFRVFSRILTDIGDRQSIDESLSTFSSHMIRLRDILQAADSDTLVLVDELGTGTEPSEGAALATTITEALLQCGCTAVVTSHHQELTRLSHDEQKGIRLAAVSFDEDRLEPTYQLDYDLPGASHAIEIASRIGLPKNLIRQAQKLARSSDAGKAAGLSLELARQLRHLKEERELMEARNRDLEEVRIRVQRLQSQLKEERKTLAKELQQRFDTMMQEFRKEKERVFRNVPERDREDVNRLEEQIHQRFAENVDQKVDGSERKGNPEFKPGDAVRHLLTAMEGEVKEVSRKGDSICITVRGKEMWVAPGDLDPLNRKVSKSQQTKVRLGREPLVQPQLECNVVGLTVEDAIGKLEKEMDKAVLAGVEVMRVVHGHGTGRLRKGLRAYIKKSPYVDRHEADTNDGATIIFLK